MTNEQLLARAEYQLVKYRLKAESAEDALRDIALFLSCGGYNDIELVEFDAAKYAKKIKETITQQLIQRRESEDAFWSRYAPAEPIQGTPIQ